MSSNEDNEKPGPSKSKDESPAISKTVSWSITEKDGAATGESDQSSEPKKSNSKVRRQSLVGTSGYVSQILTQFLQDGPEQMHDDRTQKPIRKQSIQERRASLKAVEADMEYYMKEASFPRPKRSSSSFKLLPLTSADATSKQEKLAIPLPDDIRPSSRWKPSNILDNEKCGVQVERSWVGTYIVGKDYWSEEEKIADDRPEEVRYTMDTDKMAWYDISLSGEKPESKLQALKSRSQSKMDALKNEMDEEYEEKRKQRMISAASARQAPTTTEEFSEEFRDCFKEVSKTNNFSRNGTHISMSDADRWLEKAGIVDHSHVTLIHTGLCFLASGGSRHRGLAFDEFVYYLEMMAHTCGKPLRDVVRRLTACQRDPDYIIE